MKKLDELRLEVRSIKPDLVAVAESWTHDGLTNAFLNLDGYELEVRQDRAGRGGQSFSTHL